jgi:hypothetical protein
MLASNHMMSMFSIWSKLVSKDIMHAIEHSASILSMQKVSIAFPSPCGFTENDILKVKAPMQCQSGMLCAVSGKLMRLSSHAVLPEDCHLSVDEPLPASAAADNKALATTSRHCKTISIFLGKAVPEIIWDRLASEHQPIRQALLYIAAACQWAGSPQQIEPGCIVAHFASLQLLADILGAAGRRWIQEQNMQDWHKCGKRCERREDRT